MIDHILRFTIPAAYSLLPVHMTSPKASALLLAIGLQESQFLDRRQAEGGPARGFWQFERAGISGVLQHDATRAPALEALRTLRYDGAGASFCLALVEDNDTLACLFARLLIWTLPAELPGRHEARVAWSQYREAWRPGKPHLATWDANYAEAWARVDALTLEPFEPFI
jgi:hypothetical protein